MKTTAVYVTFPPRKAGLQPFLRSSFARSIRRGTTRNRAHWHTFPDVRLTVSLQCNLLLLQSSIVSIPSH